MPQTGMEFDIQPETATPVSAQDKTDIRDLLDNWVVWRDSGDWDRFATVWHSDGRMIATWFQADAAAFIGACRKSFENGLVGLHSLGGSSIDVQGGRAVAQTRMQIVQRSSVHGVAVDVTCQGRFVDALEKRNGTWGIVLRQPVYELDHIRTLKPGADLELDQELLDSFPEGYRHLAYAQTKMGFEVRKDLPGTRGQPIEALMHRMRDWLSGQDASCLT